jgi:hypothetical protein
MANLSSGPNPIRPIPRILVPTNIGAKDRLQQHARVTHEYGIKDGGNILV